MPDGYSLPGVILQGYIIVPESDLQTVTEELENHTRLTLEEEGCLVFSISRDEATPGRFNVYEEFKDEQAFLAHQERVRLSRWGEITKSVERHYHVEGLEES